MYVLSVRSPMNIVVELNRQVPNEIKTITFSQVLHIFSSLVQLQDAR